MLALALATSGWGWMLSSRIGEAANEAHFFKASEILYEKARLKSRCGAALVDGADFSYGNTSRWVQGSPLAMSAQVGTLRKGARGGGE
jgi:hypothetical protein